MRFIPLLYWLARGHWAMLILLLFSPPLAAQSIRSRSLSLAQGLPDYFVSGLVQDRVGFIWIATLDGLARYDGRTFNVFRHQPGNPRSLAGNVLLSLQTVSDSTLLIQHNDGGLQLFNPLTETASPLLTRQQLSQLGVQVNQALLSPDGRSLWGRNERQLIHYRPDQHRLTRYALPPLPLAKDTYPGNTLCFDASGKNLYLPFPGGLVEFNPATRHYTQWPYPALGRPAANPTYYGIPLARRANGELLTGGVGQLILFDPRSHRFRTLSIPSPLATTVGRLYAAPDGQVYFTYGMTIYRLDPADHIIPLWQANRVNYQNYFQALLLDRSGVLWIGTNGDGIQQLDLHALPIQTIPYQLDFWGTVVQRGLQKPLPDWMRQPNSLYYFRWQTPYLTGYADGAFRLWQLDRFAQRLVPRLALRPALPPAFTGRGHGRRPRTEGGLWLYLSAMGLLEIDASGQIVQTFPFLIDQISDIQILGDWVWLSTEFDGLYGYDRRRRRLVVHMRHQEQKPGSLLTNQLTCLAPDPNDSTVLWVGSKEGLSRLDTRTLTCRHWSRPQGLPSAVINTLLADGQGQLWFSTLRSISRLNPRTGQLRHYTTQDGLPDIEYLPRWGTRLADGQLAFGGLNAIIQFDPKRMKETRYPLPTALTELTIGHTKVEHQLAGSPLRVPLNQTARLLLDHTQNFISLAFAGLQYNQPQQLRYRYQLLGVDADWVYAGEQPVAHYTQLTPGHYTFQVTAAPAGGPWSPLIKRIQIIVAPPWWRTGWAYGLYALLTALLIHTYIRLRLTVALKQQEARQLQTLSELKSRFFTNITHEFRTPLTLILGPLERLNGVVPKPERRWLATIEQNAQRLLSLINQLLELAKLDAHQLAIQPIRASLPLTMSQLRASFAEQAAQQGIQLVEQSALGSDFYWFDIDKFVQISTNLLANALKWTPPGGRIEIALAEQPPRLAMGSEPGGIYLTISDTGVGIPAQAIPFVFDRFYQVPTVPTFSAQDGPRSVDAGTGIGLALVKELVELQGGWVRVSSHQSELNPWTTQFTVWLPCRPVPVSPSVDGSVPAEIAAGERETPDSKTGEPAPQVLIVEDHSELAQFIAQCLPAYYQITRAGNGQEGLRLAGEQLPDLVIADVMMPILDGLSLCERLKADRATSHIPVLLLTAKAGQAHQLMGLERGANDYLTKPFHPQELRLRVGNLLRAQQRQRAWLHQQLTQVAVPAEPVSAPVDPFLVQLEGVLAGILAQPDYTVEELSQAMGISYRTLHRKLATLTGLTAGELMRAYRLRQAAQWLGQGQSVGQVATGVGFESLSYFSKCFKEQFGQSPSAYAAQKAGR